jgi:hypothetical protein
MESVDFEESEKEYLKILKEKEKIKNTKETLESFKEYLTIIINSVNEGNHNEDMTDDLCSIINKYYKNLDSDVQSDSEDESSNSSDESSNSSDESSDSNEEDNKPLKLKNITEESDSDDSESYINFFQPTKTEEKKETKKEVKKEDIYFEPFINNLADINKRIFQINHDIPKKIKIYTQKVYSY